MISFDREQQIFHLQTEHSSYLIGIFAGKCLLHIHYGRRVEHCADMFAMMDRPAESRYDWNPKCMELGEQFALCEQTLEFPTFGDGDYRSPGFHGEYADGSTVSKLYYTGHRIFAGKQALGELPSAYTEAGDQTVTLEITLADQLTGLRAYLYYTVYPAWDIITRSVRYENSGTAPILLKKVDSAVVDFDRMNFDFVHFYGTWARERQMERRPLFYGDQSVDSSRGASSHTQNPFVCLSAREATEDFGEVYGLNLIYSGNFHAGAYVDTFGKTRLYIGINSFDFSWKLDCSESFQTPEAILAYSHSGFAALSHRMHSFVRNRICRGPFRDIRRPVLINNWEATYFDFDEEKLVKLAEKAASVGVELMVLDDGWFGHRDDDRSSLGDWYEHRGRLPGGLEPLVKRIHALGMKFGLWVEPEMISEDSELYRAHPDWCIHTAGRRCSEGRHQLVLDLSRPEVCDYLIETLSRLFSRVPVEYIKWDINRNMTEVCSAALPPDRQREVAHRYMIGLYRVLGTLKQRFPHILMEGCAGGGGRFDLGMLCYFDQIWLSDDTDAVERQYLPTGSSYGYPFSVMGAHVSACPNHQTGRVTPFRTRGYAAIPGQFGYELDLGKLTEGELEEVRQQIRLYKELAPVFHDGTFYRICSPETDRKTVWEFVSPDRKTVVVEIFTVQAQAAAPMERFCLKGLQPDALYTDRLTGRQYWGDVLMHMGLMRARKQDYDGEMLILEQTAAGAQR